ncbi:hypothetical protein M409DRAFT_71146 [Zasmidium cellare ATCC 36951]|uniref:D-isomer specific 2-hydroxyacid dehydrogenase NAD-binding domain-containing protein n=1 Tax=Zasmidium cellare ATCC 36951 TaxID=1080233 RepID=A0A6A6BXE2_ZASCE|nr:uncharacterized protein M409DRAFT_71146 [Zasmidium cellare ATCC 36951]KAF2159253.1 hypothetical protein M409DRAFT_71146 [Zasmidium cellare ATCC 36951]
MRNRKRGIRPVHSRLHDTITYLPSSQNVDIIATIAALPSSKTVCPRLKLCHALTAGTDYVSRSPLFKDPSIRWTYSTGIHGPAMAEWTMMTYMAFSKALNENWERQRRKEWSMKFEAMGQRDLVGQRMGILGYGSIGRQIAKVATAMSMEVVAFTATAKETTESRRDTGYRLPGTGDPEGEFPKAWYHGLDRTALHHFLAQGIDILVVVVPMTDKTRGMLGREEFDILAKHSPYGGAFITNLARGEVIVQDELIEALKTEGSGVRGAALDVQTPEPLPPDSPLWDAPNCFIAPHSSSQNFKYTERALAILLEDLRKPPGSKFINEVNHQRGY